MTVRSKALGPKLDSTAVIFWWSFIRLVLIVTLWISAVWGSVVNVVTDGLDGVVLRKLGFRRKWYLRYDKRLDFGWSVAMILYAYLYLEKDLVWWWMVGSFLYYAAGFILYQFKSAAWVMMVFPNMFWELFFVKVAFPEILSWVFVVRAPYPVIVLLAVFAFTKEWWIHIAEIAMSYLFVKSDAEWSAR